MKTDESQRLQSAGVENFFNYFVDFVKVTKRGIWVFIWILNLYIYPSISLSIHPCSCALEKLTNRKRRLTLYSGGTSQRLTMELASVVSLQFKHGLKMTDTLRLCGGAESNLYACWERLSINHSGNCTTSYLFGARFFLFFGRYTLLQIKSIWII
jgi:hypothetical protein